MVAGRGGGCGACKQVIVKERRVRLVLKGREGSKWKGNSVRELSSEGSGKSVQREVEE